MLNDLVELRPNEADSTMNLSRIPSVPHHHFEG